jgi:hypothetical protein
MPLHGTNQNKEQSTVVLHMSDFFCVGVWFSEFLVDSSLMQASQPGKPTTILVLSCLASLES